MCGLSKRLRIHRPRTKFIDVQKANRSTSNHNILAAHLYPVGEFRDAAGGVVPGELLQLGHECRIVLDIRSRLVQDRPSA